MESRNVGEVTLVTLNRPDVRNAVDAGTARALHQAFVAFDADGQGRVAVFHGALEAAMALANQLAAFPQQTMLADRASAYAQWDLSLPEALHQQWERGKDCIGEGLKGATRFAAGARRQGKFQL